MHLMARLITTRADRVLLENPETSASWHLMMLETLFLRAEQQGLEVHMTLEKVNE